MPRKKYISKKFVETSSDSDNLSDNEKNASASRINTINGSRAVTGSKFTRRIFYKSKEFLKTSSESETSSDSDSTTSSTSSTSSSSSSTSGSYTTTGSDSTSDSDTTSENETLSVISDLSDISDTSFSKYIEKNPDYDLISDVSLTDYERVTNNQDQEFETVSDEDDLTKTSKTMDPRLFTSYVRLTRSKKIENLFITQFKKQKNIVCCHRRKALIRRRCKACLNFFVKK